MDANRKLTIQEIHAFYGGELDKICPPVCSPEQLGQLLGYERTTIYEWIAKKRFEGAYRKRGKHLRFIRDRALLLFFNGADWK